MRLPHRLQGQKVKSQGGAGAYCGGDLAAQLILFSYFEIGNAFIQYMYKVAMESSLCRVAGAE